MSTITLVITSRDRPNFLVETIQSILNQTIKPDEFIVSDDSVFSEIEIKKIEKKFPNVNFIYRGGVLTNPDHIYIIFNECKTDLLTICGDDDILNKNYIEEILIVKEKFNQSSAYGVNGRSLINGELGKKLMWKSSKDYLIIDPLTLLKRWIDVDLGGVPAVSGYTFNMHICKPAIDSNKPDLLKGGQYWDTLFFYNFSRIRNIIWINKDLIQYRIHQGSLSSRSMFGYKIFIVYLKKNKDLFSKVDKLIRKYRYLHLLIALKNKKKLFYRFLGFKLFVFLFINSNFFRKNFFVQILKFFGK